MGETPADVLHRQNRQLAATVFGMPKPWDPMEAPLWFYLACELIRRLVLQTQLWIPIPLPFWLLSPVAIFISVAPLTLCIWLQGSPHPRT